jgi:PKHD-type hydroxylase
MALTTLWYETQLPKSITTEMITTLKEFDPELKLSTIDGSNHNPFIRDSKNTWVSDINWIGAFVWYYVNKANKENFLYDITEIENASMQYAEYNVGEFYSWHADQDLPSFYKPKILGKEMLSNTSTINEDYLIKKNESVRKLTVSIQLSDYDEYEGGNLEFKDLMDNIFVAPRTLGSVIIYDSRTIHQVTPVRSGVRKSLVCWIQGPRWK